MDLVAEAHKTRASQDLDLLLVFLESDGCKRVATAYNAFPRSSGRAELQAVVQGLPGKPFVLLFQENTR